MKAEIWTVSFVASLGLHVLVVAALIGFGSLPSSTPPAPSAPSEQPPAAVAATTPESQVPVPTADTGSVPSVDKDTKDAVPVPAADTGTVPSVDKYYTVKAGDNLTKIAKLDGSTLAELAELNDKSIKELSRLKAGQRIKVKNGVEQ